MRFKGGMKRATTRRQDKKTTRQKDKKTTRQKDDKTRRREKAKKKLISYVSAERERLHRNILKNTTERQDKTDQGTTVMTITKIK